MSSLTWKITDPLMLLLFFTKQELGTILKINFMEGNIQCTPDIKHILRSIVQWVLTAVHTKRRQNTSITPKSFFLFLCCSFFPLLLPCRAVLSRFSPVQLFATLWTVAHQDLLFMGFSRQEYWSGLLSLEGSRGSSQPMDSTCVSSVSCIGRWVLYN